MLHSIPLVLFLALGAPDPAPARPAAAVAPRPTPPARPAAAVAPRPTPPARRVTGPPKEKPRSRRWPTRIGPFEVVSADRRNRLALGFAGQLQGELRVHDLGRDNPADKLTPMLRRIRLLLLGNFGSQHLKYYLQLSTAPGSLELLDLFLEYRFHRHVRLRVGQYMIPFSHHREASFRTHTFVDWSILVTGFGSERQLGAHLHNDFSGPTGFFYAVGVFAGQNARKTHHRLLAEAWGESLPNPSDLTGPAPLERIHPELVARVAYKTGGIDIKEDTDFKGTGPRFAATLGLAWDLDPDPYRDQALRGVAELLFKARFASLYAALYVATAREDSRFSQRFAMLGGLIQASYLIRRRFAVALRYGVVCFDQRLLDDARQRAAELIGAEPDPDAREALEAQYGNAGTVQREHELTAGLNVYLVGHDLKLQLDVSWLGHERAAGFRNDLRSRLQLQLTF